MKKSHAIELANQAAQIFKESGASSVILFGSLNSNEFDESSSDIDIAVAGIPIDRFNRVAGKVLCNVADVFHIIPAELANVELQEEISLGRELLK